VQPRISNLPKGVIKSIDASREPQVTNKVSKIEKIKAGILELESIEKQQIDKKS